MVVRIRVARPQGNGAWKPRLASGLRMTAAVCFLTGVWIIAAGLRWAGAFPLEQGLFSHWQVWMASGVLALLTAFRLSRPKRQLIS